MGQKKTLTLTTSWLRPVLELLHTVVLLDVCFLKKHQLQRPTKERPGFSLELRTLMLFYMMMSGKLLRRHTLTTSDLIMHYHVNKKTRKVEKCTFRIRERSMLMKSSQSWIKVLIFTSAVLRV